MSTTTVPPDMEISEAVVAKILELVDHGLCEGLGSPQPDQMCFNAVICYALGLPHGDRPPCEGSSVTAATVRLNDSGWSSDQTRAAGMRRLAMASLGSNTLDQLEFSRRLLLATVRVMLPVALRSASSPHPDSAHKIALEAAAAICEGCSFEAAESTALTALAAAESAARSAAWAASASAWAASAASAGSAEWAASAAKDKVLSQYAEIMVGILVEMGSPGCQWLHLTSLGGK